MVLGDGDFWSLYLLIPESFLPEVANESLGYWGWEEINEFSS